MPFRRRAAPPPTDATLVAGGPPPGGPVPPGGPEPPESPPERELWPWLLAFLILVLGGVAAAYVLSGDDGKKSSATTTTTQTTSPALSSPEPGTTATTTTTTTANDGKVAVPRVVGLRTDAATEQLRKAKLGADTRDVFADRPAGIVVRQRPTPGQEVADGSRVLLEVSKGPQPAPVPSVIGTNEQDAAARLEAAGFGAIVYDVPAADPKGTVVAQAPKPGEEAPRGSRVRINVSTGEQQGEEAEREPPATATVGDFVGQKRKAAADAIRKAGLKPDTKYVPSSKPADTVVAQSPKPGTTVKRGSGVRINISKGPKPRPDADVPDTVGLDEPTATGELEAAGFVVEVVQQEVTDPAQDGVVIEQSPVGGERAPQGATVTIVVGFLSSG